MGNMTIDTASIVWGLVFGTIGIALLAGWILKRFGPPKP